MKKLNFAFLCQLFVLSLIGLISTTAQAQTVKYKYDALGRLTFVEDAVNSNRTFKYDAAGNRTKVIGLDLVPPSNPSGLAVLARTGSSARIGWTASTDAVGVSSYEYNLNGGAWIATPLTAVTATGFGPTTTVTVTGLAPSTTYTFSVRAKDESNNSSGTVSISFATSLNAPTGLSCYENWGPGAWQGKWSAVPGAHHYVFKASNQSEISVTGTTTSSPIQQSSKPCSWVQACDASNVCGAQAYF